jgi:hypothetical protein
VVDLHVELTPVSAHDLFVCPRLAVGEEERLSEQGPLQMVPSLLTEGPLERWKPLSVELDDDLEQVLHVAPRKNGSDPLAGACQSGASTSGAPLGVTFERCLQHLEPAPPFVDLSTQRLALGLQQGTVDGDQDRTLGAEDLLASAVGPDRRQLGLVQTTHLGPLDGQQFRVLRGHQRADEMKRTLGDRPQVGRRVVALVEDQGDVDGALRQLAAASRELAGDRAEGFGVVLVAGVGVVEQRHIAVGRDEQG